MRNPYPVPDMSSEGEWMPPGPTLSNNVSINDRDWWSKVRTHERLFSHHTLTSIRRDSRLIKNDELVPVDALDFALSSIYIHSEDCNVPKMYVPMQPESLNMETWRVLRNEINNASGQISLSMKSIPKHTNTTNTTNHTNRRKSSSASYSGSSAIKNKTTTVNKTKMKTNNNNKVNKSGRGGGIGKNKSGGRSARSKSRGRSSVSSRRKNGPKPVVGNRQRNNNKLSSIKNKRSHNDQDEKDDDSREREPRRKNFAAQMMAIERIHPSSIKLAIDGPHTDQTNPGFSRKIDGTFYSI
ncbi:LIM domain-containing protein A-like [Aphidius gifuensis]|uniref:LIM domain-containing protein A-like n=1 Tax=Aphidius gifuensis TaxID=684658 RepID=UPI001CDD4E32|nr:LIM domain-containing protein A-like [Aphidius gifuensis]